MEHYFEKQALIAVAKDEKYLLLLKKFIETSSKKRNEEKSIVFDVVTWDEKTWLAQKAIGQITSKVLLIGSIKDSNKLLPFIDVKFDKYGVKYGWSGRQALISVDHTVLEKSKDFPQFVEEFNNLEIPEQYKIKPKDDSTKLKRARNKVVATALAGFRGFLYEELYTSITNKSELIDKLLIYGVVQFYKQHIHEFMEF